MKAFFAVGDGATAKRMLAGHRVLMSFAYFGTRWLPVSDVGLIAGAADEVMIDSGAFTAWRKGTPIDRAHYERLLLSGAFPWDVAICLDVIGDADASVEAWRYFRKVSAFRDRMMPVWHEGDPAEHLDEYIDTAHAVALGRIAGRRSEPKTFEFYDEAFNRHPDGKFHALGNANPTHLEPYPFASFDSTGWQRDAAYSNAAKWPFNRCDRETRMRAYIEATETIAHRPSPQLRLAYSARAERAQEPA